MEKTNCLREIIKVDISELKKFTMSISEDKWDHWKNRPAILVDGKPGINAYTRTIPFIWSIPQAFSDNDYTIHTQLMNRNCEISILIKPYYNFLENFFGGECIRVFLAQLRPFKNIGRHVDCNDTLTKVHRCHLPILTNNNVIFGIGNADFNLKEGILYEVNNIDPHYVNNNSNENRVHLIMDILPFKYNCKILKSY
jgi:hypothetical protein